MANRVIIIIYEIMNHSKPIPKHKTSQTNKNLVSQFQILLFFIDIFKQTKMQNYVPHKKYSGKC